jgi:hypothetical protein
MTALSNRGHFMQRSTLPVTISFLFMAACSGITTDRVVIQGAGPDEFLKLQAGPGLGFSVILGLPDGTAVDRYDCVTELGQLWYCVSLADAPQMAGYVSADYLSEP